MSRARVTVFLLGLGVAWNAGNVGPVVSQIASEFDVSLSQVGLLSGSVFCAGIAAAGFGGSWISERMSVVGGLKLCCALAVGGNVLMAASPEYELALVARIAIGFALGLAFLFGGVFARHEGGAALVGLFGAGITLGMAFASIVGGLLVDLDVDWRIAFALSALVAIPPLVLLPRHSEAAAPEHEPALQVLRRAVTSSGFWRLEGIAIAAFTVPIVIGAWLVHYLIIEGVSASTAGLVAFTLFGVSAGARDLSGHLLARGVPSPALSVGGCAIGAAGLALLAVEPSAAGAFAASVLIGIGLSLPYAVVYDEGVRIVPGASVGGLGMSQATSAVFPIPVTPLLGAAIAAGDSTLGWLALGAFVLVGGLLNLRPAVPPEGTGPERAFRAHEGRGTLAR